MSNLYLKTVMLAILISLFLLGSFYLVFFHFIDLNRLTLNRLFINGNFAMIQQQLKDKPPSSWPKLINSIGPADRPQAKILNIKDLSLTKPQQEDLKQGKIVIYTAPLQLFLNDWLPDLFALQKIGNSDSVLQIQDGVTMYSTIHDNSRWMLHLITRTLKATNKSNWPKIINHFQSMYHIPLQLISINQLPLPLKNKSFVQGLIYDPPNAQGFISKMYFKLEGFDKILIMGPVDYPKFLIKPPKVQFYYLVSFTLLTALTVFLFTWIFSRNVRKIFGLTHAYSQGIFDKTIRFSKLSILYGVYQNIVSMGGKIKTLMNSQQNMSRFVAHEIRPPLHTMQLALDAMEKTLNNKDDPAKHIQSLKENIQELNQLVSTFLIYSQSSSHEMTLKKRVLDIKHWLFELVKGHQDCDLKVILNTGDEEPILVEFDPDLLKFSITHLIRNALKFARHTIQISLTEENKQIFIHVDVDGMGIEEENKHAVFQAFVSPKTEASFGEHIGLGLSIAKSIIERHGGHIVLEDSPILSGSRFGIYLPE